MLLQANNLSCVREDRTLFEHLSFAVRAGDLMQIEGPNGVGKTSLLRLLTGLSDLVQLELVDSRAFESGAVALRYARRA